MYIFEAPQGDMLVNGQPQIGQSRLLEQQDDPNHIEAYAQLHLGEVASGAQAVVFYENGGTTGAATFERTSTTSGMRNWCMREVQMTANGPRSKDHDSVTVATDDADGFMNRHMFLKPGDTLATMASDHTAYVKTLGTIVSVHLIGQPREPQRIPAIVPITPASAREFAHAA